MILAWWIFWVSLALLVACFALAFVNDAPGWAWAAWLPGLSALIFLIGGLVISLGRHYGRVACHTFAAQTHRPTRFVIYTAWDGGDCLTRTSDGKWIPTKNLREFGDKP